MNELQKKAEFQRQLKRLLFSSSVEERQRLVKYVQPVPNAQNSGINRIGDLLPDVMNEIYRRVNIKEKCGA